uniref:Ground-like domain-containing protein n=1 Tax=Acrobeloides nanus TaxID=290746 RepID=A0A914DY33_9BILA
MFDSDYTSHLFPTLISSDNHALSTTTQALSTTTTLATTTTTDYLNNNTHELSTTPWDAPAMSSMVTEPGMCTYQTCDPATNQISEVPVPCGCHPGQKPANLPTPGPMPPDCYMNNDGYVCCDRELEEMLSKTFDEFKESRCGPQTTANKQALASFVQKKLEIMMPNMTIEAVIGNSDFVAKVQFSGSGMCKIRRNCQ